MENYWDPAGIHETKNPIRMEGNDFERKLACNIKANVESLYGYINQKEAAKICVGPLENEVVN